MKTEVFYTLLLLAAVACTADLKDDERGAEMQSYEITAVCGDDVIDENGTKTSFVPNPGGNSGRVNWLEGDEIAVFTPAGVKYTMTALSSGLEVRFRGDLPQGTTQIYAVYPNDASATYSDGVITTTLKSQQTATVNGFQDELAILSAAGDISNPSNVLSFKNACGLVKFHVKDAEVKKVKIVATNVNTAITGKAAVTASTGVSSAVAANNVVELVPPAGDTYFIGDQIYYFTALPGTISGFTMYYECENGIKSRSTAKSMTVSRSAVSVISGNEDDPGWVSDAIVLSQVAKSSSTATFGWNYLGSPDATRDYAVYLYSDADCSNLVVSWVIKSAKFSENAPRFIFTGLAPNTTYYAKVQDRATGHYSNVVSVTTDAFVPVTIGESGSAKVNDIILAEDFSELIFGGDFVNKACGYADTLIGGQSTSAQPKFVLTEMKKAEGSYSTFKNELMVETSNRMYYASSVLGKPLLNTRLKDWAYRDVNNKYNRTMCLPGAFGVSNTASTGYIYTPSLSSMSKAGKLKVTFKAVANGYDKISVGYATGAIVAESTGEPSTGYGFASSSMLTVCKSFDLTSDWKTYSLDIEDVPADARIAFGVADGASITVGTYPQIAIDEVTVQLLEYNEEVVGNPLAPWKAGYMDIHFISSWSGECLFIAYPDGTTMIIDAAGDDSAENNPKIRSKWEEQQAGITGKCGTALICDYISYHLSRMGKSKIDYVLLTHYHPDHMGTYHSTAYTGYKVSKTSKPTGTGSAQWTLNGITMVMEKFAVGKFVDRDYSASASESESHSYPMQLYVKKSSTLKGQTSTVYPIAGNTSQGYVKLSQMNNYRYMIRSIEDNKWTAIEKFAVGSNTQFKPLYDATNYDVEVRNLGAQGLFWTGSGTSTSQIFPVGSALEYIVPTDGSSIDKDGTYGHNCPAENHNSCCLKFTWGKFTFGTFGDNTYVDSDKFSWKNAEKPISNHIGQCDLLKASHHGLDGCTSSNLTNATQPLVWVVDNWNDSQGDIGPVKRLPATTEMYFTNMTTDILNELSAYSSRIKGYDGHVVVRVTDGGSYFKVYMLDYGKAGYPVKYVSSKFTSK